MSKKFLLRSSKDKVHAPHRFCQVRTYILVTDNCSYCTPLADWVKLPGISFTGSNLIFNGLQGLDLINSPKA